MKKIILIVFLSVFSGQLCFGQAASGIVEVTTDINLNAAPMYIDAVYLHPTGNNAAVAIYSATDATSAVASTRIFIASGPATNDGVTPTSTSVPTSTQTPTVNPTPDVVVYTTPHPATVTSAEDTFTVVLSATDTTGLDKAYFYWDTIVLGATVDLAGATTNATATASVLYGLPGDYQFKTVVTDSLGASATDINDVTVEE